MTTALFVTNSLAQGGAEQHAITLLNGLAARGHDCHLAFVRQGRDLLARVEVPQTSHVQCLDAQRFLDRAALHRLATLIDDVEADVIVAANEYSLLYASLARRRTRSRPKIVVTYHSTRLATLKERLQMVCYRPLFWAAACAVFVCETQRRYWLRRGVFAKRNEVIYNGIDTQAYAPSAERKPGDLVRRDLGIGDKDFVIGIAAGLRPVKNHLQLVDAVRELRSSGVPAVALLIGDGEMRAAIMRRAREIGVDAQVLITGFQADVRPFISLCDAMVLCSFTETLSLAAIEAMSMEKPFVHSRVGGAGELIQPDWNGYLFPAGNTAALVSCLRRLTDLGRARIMGRNARLGVEQRFSERTMIDRYETLLLELAKDESSGLLANAGRS